MAKIHDPVANELELVITRMFDAPRELVWKAWTESERVLQWLGPSGFTATEFKLDPSPGGRWHSRMHDPDGKVYANRGIVHEAIEPERMEFTFAWDNDDGTPGRQMLISIELEDRNGKTQMTFRQAEFESRDDRDGHNDGWSQSFDKLAFYLSTQ